MLPVVPSVHAHPWSVQIHVDTTHAVLHMTAVTITTPKHAPTAATRKAAITQATRCRRWSFLPSSVLHSLSLGWIMSTTKLEIQYYLQHCKKHTCVSLSGMSTKHKKLEKTGTDQSPSTGTSRIITLFAVGMFVALVISTGIVVGVVYTLFAPAELAKLKALSKYIDVYDDHPGTVSMDSVLVFTADTVIANNVIDISTREKEARSTDLWPLPVYNASTETQVIEVSKFVDSYAFYLRVQNDTVLSADTVTYNLLLCVPVTPQSYTQTFVSTGGYTVSYPEYSTDPVGYLSRWAALDMSSRVMTPDDIANLLEQGEEGEEVYMEIQRMTNYDAINDWPSNINDMSYPSTFENYTVISVVVTYTPSQLMAYSLTDDGNLALCPWIYYLWEGQAEPGTYPYANMQADCGQNQCEYTDYNDSGCLIYVEVSLLPTNS